MFKKINTVYSNMTHEDKTFHAFSMERNWYVKTKIVLGLI